VLASLAKLSGKVVPGQQAVADCEDLRRRLSGARAERFGVGLVVVLSQNLADLPGRWAAVGWQIWRRVTGSCVTTTASDGNVIHSHP
jgi:hypothetical protein